MQPVLTVEQMRAVDEAAQASVPLAALVERAGTAVAVEVLAALGEIGGAYGRRVALVAGPGNNGNDGRVAAGILERRGARVQVFDAKAPPAEIAGADVVVDAAFGTGFRGSYDAPRVPPGIEVVAVDVPTGVDAMTGETRGEAVTASRTVTFGAAKPGLFLNDAPLHSGRVRVERIGLPIDVVAPEIWQVEDEDVEARIPRRRHDDHKWRSALLVVSGSVGMYGAATFVARSAMRAGAGFVRLAIPGADPGQLPVGEAVAKVLPAEGFAADALEEIDRFKALAVGPGIGRSKAAGEAVRRLVAGSGAVPTLVDADGLYAFGSAKQAASVIGSRSRSGGAAVVLTPHAGEFARLAGRAPGIDRIASVRALAHETGAVVLLKGSATVVASPDGRVLLSTAGSSVLATAGTGDVLSGVIAAFLARGVPALEAAALGAHVHGRAASLGIGDGLVAGDLPRLVALVLARSAGAARSGEAEAAGAAGPLASVEAVDD